MNSSRRLIQDVYALGRRALSSQPLKSVSPTETAFGEFLEVSKTAPVLVRLHERQWGALSSLPASKIQEAGYSSTTLPSKIAIIRDAFVGADEHPRKLSDSLKTLSADGRVVASLDLRHPENRLVVDEYELTTSADKRYRVSTIATDIFSFMNRYNVPLLHVPDIHAVAAAGLSGDVLPSPIIKQSTNRVLMVAPTAFVFNDQAAQDNTFMNSSTGISSTGTGSTGNAGGHTSLTKKVLEEFSLLHHKLTEDAGVKVDLFQHSFDHGTPDACFPNNWFSTHSPAEAGGGVGKRTLVFYPMKCPNRQAERRDDIIDVLRDHMGYEKIVDLTLVEKDNKFFEGTGVLVIDRVRGTAYVSLSERADRGLAERWVKELGYKDLVTFTSSDSNGGIVYHTNVMMAIGTTVAIVCLESVADDKERRNLQAKVGATHEIVDITREQMAALCGNVLELEDGNGLPVLAMSTQAYNAFTPEQKKVMRRHVAALHHAPIDTLEHIGGGGVRCTLAELF